MTSRKTNRRMFLRDGFLVTAGAAGASMFSRLGPVGPATLAGDLADEPAGVNAEARLHRLGIELPNPPQPVAVYVPAVRVGNLLFTAGHGPAQADGKMMQGRVGSQLTLEQGYSAARLVGLNVLSTVRNTLGSLDKVVRLVKVLGLVNCTPDFTKQPQVINGFSELMVQVFGEDAGKGARSAVGTNSLPSNIPVEIEAIFEVRT